MFDMKGVSGSVRTVIRDVVPCGLVEIRSLQTFCRNILTDYTASHPENSAPYSEMRMCTGERVKHCDIVASIKIPGFKSQSKNWLLQSKTFCGYHQFV